MGQFTYTTYARIAGPILIERDHLLDLDSVMADEERRLKGLAKQLSSERRQVQVDEAPKGIGNSEDGRKLSVRFGKAKAFQGGSFEEVLRQPEVEREIATKFEYVLKVGDVECKVRGGKSGAAIHIETFPQHSQEAREAFSALRHWANRIQPPRWQQFLRSIYGLFAFAFIVICLALLPDTSQTAAKDFNKARLKAEAHKLLAGGVQTNEQTRAIEILLALQSDYLSNETRSKLDAANKNSVPLLTLSGTACLILSIWPTVELAIGIGENRIKRWKLWLKLAFYTVPGWLFGIFVVPKIEAVLRSLF